MFMEEILEKAIENWTDEDNGDPLLNDEQWSDVRNSVFQRTYPNLK
jgi:hypothetical protein